MTRLEVIKHIENMDIQIKEMFAEIAANFVENDRTMRHITIALKSMEIFESKLKMLDFIHFCQTGRYPDE